MLIEVPELLQSLDNHNQILLFCRLIPVGKVGVVTTGYIPGSHVFDVAKFSKLDCLHNPDDALEFNRQLRRFAASYNSDIIVYDPIGIYAAPRVWFVLKLMGYEKVSVLNGGLPEWQRREGKIEKEAKEQAKTLYETEAEKLSPPLPVIPDENKLADVNDVLNSINNQAYKLIDVRSAGRFAGTELEPRPGIRAGHIPGSINIPFTTFLDGERLKSHDQLLSILQAHDCRPQQTLIFYCGSGVTACIGYLVAYICGYRKILVYDGSWTEWGGSPDLPISCG